jgi:hypothetical protein
MISFNQKIKVKSDNVFGNSYIEINSDNIEDIIKKIYKHDVRTIVIKTYEGYKLKNLNWLKNCPFINKVHLFCYEDNFDMSGLHFLKELELLNLNVTAKKISSEIDFKNFSRLKNCSIDWNSKMKNLFMCKSIERLHLRKFKANDLSQMKNLTSLKELLLNNSSIVTLLGIENLGITNLELSYLKKLESIKGIDCLRDTLLTLEIENCSKIERINGFESLYALNKLGLNNCKEIESLKPIENLKKLKWLDFWGNTKISDGDMSPCIGIDKVAFENRKHYNYKNEEIDKLNQK